MLKRWLSISLRMFAGFVLATVIFEGYLRLVEVTPLWRVLPAAQINIYGPDPDVGYAIRPNVSGVWLTENRARITTSPQGLRDRDRPFDKPAGTRRIAIAGDSIVEALQVEQDRTFTALLEQHYQRAGKKIEVVNLGISGALPTVELVRVKALGLRFHPDLMVFIVKASDFMAPDMRRDQQFVGYVRAADGSYQLGDAFRKTRSYRLRTSVLGRLIYAGIDHLRVLRVLNALRNRSFALGGNGGGEGDPKDTCDPGRFTRLVSIFEPPPAELPAAKILDAYLRDVAALSKAAGVPAVFAMKWLPANCPAEKAALAALRQVAIKRIESAAIGVIDLGARIAKAINDEGIDQRFNDLFGFGARLGFGHLNYRGHQVYAAALAAGLSSWIDGSRPATGPRPEVVRQ